MRTEPGRSASRVYGWLEERSGIHRARAGVSLPGFAAGGSAKERGVSDDVDGGPAAGLPSGCPGTSP